MLLIFPSLTKSFSQCTRILQEFIIQTQEFNRRGPRPMETAATLQDYVITPQLMTHHSQETLGSRISKAILNGNITILDSKIEEHKLIEENLTAEISLQKDHIEALEHNLTLKAQELASCEALHLASKQLQTAAEKQKQACETTKQYLQKQLTKCKDVDQHKHEYHVELDDSGAQGITTSSVTLAMIVCLSLLLVPCKCILCLSESYLEYSS
uniref:Si:ch211-1a19.3 n=1 Tax=Sinocyclocheilus grahami TaxID=75366 RepID=A0A672RA34_SINGR